MGRVSWEKENWKDKRRKQLLATEILVCVSRSVVPDSATPWTAVCQAPLSMGFSRQELEWTAISFSMGSFCPRDQTQVSYIAGRRFTVWATREAFIDSGAHVYLNDQSTA